MKEKRNKNKIVITSLVILALSLIGFNTIYNHFDKRELLVKINKLCIENQQLKLQLFKCNNTQMQAKEIIKGKEDKTLIYW
ncbi:MAG: hypothetical protein EKK61_03775 [Rickettsiales bacterium]|nr:MAG: hypothetical protein EKK61_03775 [Rickettsiales bacterium]